MIIVGFFLGGEWGEVDPAGADSFCPKSPTGDAGPQPFADLHPSTRLPAAPLLTGCGARTSRKSTWDQLLNCKIPEGRAQGSPGHLHSTKHPVRLKEWTPRVYNCTPMTERETPGLILLRNWSNSSLGQMTWTKCFAWVRIKSKSFEEREKKKKEEKGRNKTVKSHFTSSYPGDWHSSFFFLLPIFH